MSRTVTLDFTRLISRFPRLTPSGIDRVELHYFDHFLRRHGAKAIVPTIIGPRVIDTDPARKILEAIETRWREDLGPDEDAGYQYILSKFRGEAMLPRREVPARWLDLVGSALGAFVAGGLGAGGIFPGRGADAVPRDSVYLDAGMFLWAPRFLKRLKQQRGAHLVFMVHDLLPLQYPEYFRASDASTFEAALDELVDIAAAVIVTTPETERLLRDRAAARGRAHMPVFVRALPVSPIFAQPAYREPTLADSPYFVICATIEPRKNHLLLFQIWREFAKSMKGAVPKLVVVGALGWENENALDMLQRCPGLEGNVIAVHSLGTQSLKRLLDNSCGLLMPSFAEGFGLPVAEAVAAGVPVVASDIPSFRGIGDSAATYLNPIDGKGWRQAIMDLLARPKTIGAGTGSAPAAANAGRTPVLSWDSYFHDLTGFLDALPR